MYPRRLDSFRKIWNPHTYQHWHHWYVRVIYFHLRATSTCNRVVFSPISASPGQNYNFAKNIFKSLSPLFPHRCHHHPFPSLFPLQRCNMVLMRCCLATLRTNSPTSVPCPALFQAVQTSISSPNLSCRHSKPSVVNSLRTTYQGLICSWIDKVRCSHVKGRICH